MLVFKWFRDGWRERRRERGRERERERERKKETKRTKQRRYMGEPVNLFSREQLCPLCHFHAVIRESCIKISDAIHRSGISTALKPGCVADVACALSLSRIFNFAVLFGEQDLNKSSHKRRNGQGNERCFLIREKGDRDKTLEFLVDERETWTWNNSNWLHWLRATPCSLPFQVILRVALWRRWTERVTQLG